MKVIVRLGNGKYYISKVFGIFNDNLTNYFEKNFKYYYIIFDENMKSLISKYEYNQHTKYIVPEILIYEDNISDMKIDKNGCGKVNFLTNNDMKDILSGKISNTILSKCIKYIDKSKIDYIEIKNKDDIRNFMLVSGNLHDGYIKKIYKKNNQLYVIFDGIWGCKIEIVFEGHIQYQNKREDDDLWWFGSSMILEDNGIILIDDEDYKKGDNINQSLTWFKAEKVKYKVIPN